VSGCRQPESRPLRVHPDTEDRTKALCLCGQSLCRVWLWLLFLAWLLWKHLGRWAVVVCGLIGQWRQISRKDQQDTRSDAKTQTTSQDQQDTRRDAKTQTTSHARAGEQPATRLAFLVPAEGLRVFFWRPISWVVRPERSKNRLFVKPAKTYAPTFYCQGIGF